jgi:hypothetical protein
VNEKLIEKAKSVAGEFCARIETQGADVDYVWQAIVQAVIEQHEQSKWQPIDSAPELTWVIVTNGEYVAEAFYSKYYERRGGWVMMTGDDIDKVTHWQPLPTPPKELK